MPYIEYVAKHFSAETQHTIDIANRIIADYTAQGFDLTLRQLYYQFVARGHIENTERSYKRLGDIVSDARLAGLIDWDRIVDRTRKLQKLPHWTSPAQILKAAAQGYSTDKWKNQPYRVEVWVEKEALAGVFASICDELDVPYFACRGYVSQTEMWNASQRFLEYIYQHQQKVIVLHFGDHDPSGIDMTRDVTSRLKMFLQGSFLKVERLALNFDQVEQYNPPPNPAKLSDSRASGYVEVHGYESWELDALEPAVLVDLVRQNVMHFRDDDQWTADLEQEEQERAKLLQLSREWSKDGQL